MLQISRKENLVSVSVRLAPGVVKHVRELAKATDATEGAVLRQIITDFFSPDRIQIDNSEEAR